MTDDYAAFAENIEKAKVFMEDVCVGFRREWPKGTFEFKFRYPHHQGILFDFHLKDIFGLSFMTWSLPFAQATWPEERQRMWHVLQWFEQDYEASLKKEETKP